MLEIDPVGSFHVQRYYIDFFKKNAKMQLKIFTMLDYESSLINLSLVHD